MVRKKLWPANKSPTVCPEYSLTDKNLSGACLRRLWNRLGCKTANTRFPTDDNGIYNTLTVHEAATKMREEREDPALCFGTS
jgi:hypothetical protein